MTLSKTNPEIPRLSTEELKQLLDEGEPIFFADMRRHPDDLQIKAALYYDPERILAADRVELPASKDQLIVTYCTWPQEATSARVAQRLIEQGYRKVHPPLGGFEAWRETAYPVEARSIERAVATGACQNQKARVEMGGDKWSSRKRGLLRKRCASA